MKRFLSTICLMGLVVVSQPTFAQSSCAGSTTGCMGSGYEYGINVPVSFAAFCECNWVAHIDYLYWKPYEDCLEYTTVGTTTVFEGNPVRYNLTAKNSLVNFDWDSGFRIGVGYGFPCDKWTLSVDWTHYRTDTKKVLSSASLLSLNEPTLVSFSAPFINVAEPFFDRSLISEGNFLGKWTLQYNQIDFIASRAFYVGPCVSINPHISVSFLDIKQDINVCEDFKLNPETTLDVETFARLVGRYKSEFKGVGIRAGLDSNWELCEGFGFFGEWNVAAFYGTFDTGHKSLISAFGDLQDEDNFSYNLKVDQDFEALRITNHLGIGLSWMSRFNCERNMFVFKAGWEHNVFFGQNMFPVLDIVASEGDFPIIDHIQCSLSDLYLYGFMFSFAVTF